MAYVKALSSLFMPTPSQDQFFPTLADNDFNGSNAATITENTIQYVEGTAQQGLKYTFTGVFSFSTDPVTGQISNVSGTVYSILYEFTNYLDTPEDGTEGGYEIDQLLMPVSAFHAGDRTVTLEMFANPDIIEGSDGADFLYGHGGNDTLSGFGDRDWINGGEGSDFMAGGDASDTYEVDNNRDVVIEYLDEGDHDTVNSYVTYRLPTNVEDLNLRGNELINGVGNELSNRIVGNSAKNYIYGGDGNDLIGGGFGNDVLTGGQGRDAFYFVGTPNSKTNVDKILDFDVAEDHFKLASNFYNEYPLGTLSKDAFRANKTGFAEDANDRIIYETDTGNLRYDSNGNSPGGSNVFAVIDKNLSVTHWDFLIV